MGRIYMASDNVAIDEIRARDASPRLDSRVAEGGALPSWWPSNQPWLIHDGIDVMKHLPRQSVSMVYMDPVWPNANAGLMGQSNAEELFMLAMGEVPRITNRLLVHLGCDTDPRFLRHVPESLPFVRVFWLEYCRPNYKGRVMYGSDVAYLFGEPPASRPGNRVIPGRCMETSAQGKETEHPCPRKIEHVQYLIDKCTNPGEVVFDPFLGSGTTIMACRLTGRVGLGSELNDAYEPMIVERSMHTIQRLDQFSAPRSNRKGGEAHKTNQLDKLKVTLLNKGDSRCK